MLSGQAAPGKWRPAGVPRRCQSMDDMGSRRSVVDRDTRRHPLFPTNGDITGWRCGAICSAARCWCGSGGGPGRRGAEGLTRIPIRARPSMGFCSTKSLSQDRGGPYSPPWMGATAGYMGQIGIMLLVCLSLCGCFGLGNTRLYEDQLGYSRALGDAEKSDTLLNVVRLRYADTPIVLQATQVISGYQLQRNVTGGFEAFPAAN